MFPKNKIINKLKEKMRAAGKADGDDFNGNGQQSTDDSPSSQGGRDDDVEADNSILWSSSRPGGGSFALNGSYRLEDALNSTPGRNNVSSARRVLSNPKEMSKYRNFCGRQSDVLSDFDTI